MIRSLDNSGEFNQKIVTQVEALKTFYIAEEVHQDYFKKNPDQAYCSYVIKHKLNKFRRDFSKQLRQE
jgi:peptide-methionine (S)-S-oxide reductase